MSNRTAIIIAVVVCGGLSLPIAAGIVALVVTELRRIDAEGTRNDPPADVESPDSPEPLYSFGYDPANPKPLAVKAATGGDSAASQTAVPAQKLYGHEGAVTAIAFSPQEKLLASASYDGSVRLWDTKQGTARAVLQPTDSTIYDQLLFSSDGRLLLACHHGNSSKAARIKVWDVASGEVLRVLGDTPVVSRIAFQTEPRMILGLRADKSHPALVRWKLDTGEPLDEFPLQFPNVGFDALAQAPGEDQLALCYDTNNVLLVDPATGRVHRTLETSLIETPRLAFSADGSLLAVGALGRRPKWQMEIPGFILFDPVTGKDYYSQVQVWQVASGKLLGVFTLDKMEHVMGLAFSPSGRELAVAGETCVRIWDVSVAKPVRVLTGQRPLFVTYSPDGRTLAVGANSDLSAPLDRQPVLWLWDQPTAEDVSSRAAN